MNKTNKKGFTLIELLVVIAIIGILAALVLVALGNARDKAQDARIKSDIGQLRTLAEVVYDNNGSKYTTVGDCFNSDAGAIAANCFGSEASVLSLRADAASAGGSVTSASSDTAYCVESVLKSNTTSSFCSDGTGVAKVNTTVGVCSSTNISCN